LLEFGISIARGIANYDDFIYILLFVKAVIVENLNRFVSHASIDIDSIQES